jgi:protease-4
MKKVVAALLLALWGTSAPAAGLLGRLEHGSWFKGGNKIAVVPVEGAILDTRETVRWMRTLGKDVPGLKAVVLDINSPGGAVAPSQELYAAVRRLQDEGVKVVAALGSVAASGGYYAACPADRIVAEEGTLTGSIGVLMEVGSAKKLMDKVGVHLETIKSGRFKDTGSFFRDMKPEERAVLQGVIDDVYDQFVSAVAESREGALARSMQAQGLSRRQPDPGAVKEYVKMLADGRVYSGRQALKLGLVDELGDFQQAVDSAAKLAGIQGEPVLVTRRRHASWAEMLGSLTHLDLLSHLTELAPKPGLQLLYQAW